MSVEQDKALIGKIESLFEGFIQEIDLTGSTEEPKPYTKQLEYLLKKIPDSPIKEYYSLYKNFLELKHAYFKPDYKNFREHLNKELQLINESLKKIIDISSNDRKKSDTEKYLASHCLITGFVDKDFKLSFKPQEDISPLDLQNNQNSNSPAKKGVEILRKLSKKNYDPALYTLGKFEGQLNLGDHVSAKKPWVLLHENGFSQNYEPSKREIALLFLRDCVSTEYLDSKEEKKPFTEMANGHTKEECINILKDLIENNDPNTTEEVRRHFIELGISPLKQLYPSRDGKESKLVTESESNNTFAIEEQIKIISPIKALIPLISAETPEGEAVIQALTAITNYKDTSATYTQKSQAVEDSLNKYFEKRQLKKEQIDEFIKDNTNTEEKESKFLSFSSTTNLVKKPNINTKKSSEPKKTNDGH